MNDNKSDYKRGLIYFCCLMFCICMFFITPDGDAVFYKLLRMFGIDSGIRIGKNLTLYIYMMIPLAIAIFSIRKILKYWWDYGSRFREFHLMFRYLPVFIAAIIFFASSNIMSPKGVDLIYYAVIGQRNGLKAITYSERDELRYEFTGTIRTYFYGLTFENHGNETQEFNVKLVADDFYDFQDVFIKDDNGKIKLFILPPKQKMYYSGKFNEYHLTEHESGSGHGMFSVVLVNDKEQYSPKSIIR